MKINENYLRLKNNYLFSDIARKIRAYQEKTGKSVIKMGIGDVTLPLANEVISAMHGAVDEMSAKETFKGYGDEQGYGFLQNAIKDYYAAFGVSLSADEIFISDGAKSDLGNILDLFSKDNTVIIPDPVYPVYVDTNIMDGRDIVYLDANEDNGFLPLPYEGLKGDIVYICSPNNPTGATYNREQLKKWVDFAIENGAVILFDSAYEAFISDPGLPRSVFEIEGAEKCCIEFCSFSKTAGFTGTRCGYTVVPHALKCGDTELNRLWLRRQTTKFNGVCYIVQKGAAAVFTEEGRKQIQENIDYYKENAKIIMTALDGLGIRYFGGKNSPYIWLKCPGGMDSWTFFDYLLENIQVVGTPGSGFGNNGSSFFRLTSFSTHENTAEAMRRLTELLK